MKHAIRGTGLRFKLTIPSALCLAVLLLVLQAIENGSVGQELPERSALLYRAFAAAAINTDKQAAFKWLPENHIVVRLRMLSAVSDSIRASAAAQIEKEVATISDAIGRDIAFLTDPVAASSAPVEPNIVIYLGDDATGQALEGYSREIESIVGAGIVARSEGCTSYAHVSSSLAVGHTGIIGGLIFASFPGDSATALSCISERLPMVFGLSHLAPADLQKDFGEMPAAGSLGALDLELLRGLYRTRYLESGEDADRALRLYRAYLLANE